jgi:GDP-L-fucose synthase
MSNSHPFALAGKKVWVAGHAGMVGSAIMRRLERENCTIIAAGRAELDLRDQRQTEAFIAREKPDVVFLAAAKVGGILANDSRPAEFLYDNLMIEANVLHAARGVEKLLFLGSSCIYPKLAAQPIREDALLTGPLEPTNEWYAIAKIAGLKLAQAYRRQYGARFISAMPTNLYGPHDNFDLAASHVVPALMRKIHEAKIADAPEIEVWGTGRPSREFLHVDDLADASVFLMTHYEGEVAVNVGTGEDISIRDLAELLTAIIGSNARLRFDETKPDGTPRKLLDVTLLHQIGWRHKIGLPDGLTKTYEWYRKSLVPLPPA